MKSLIDKSRNGVDLSSGDVDLAVTQLLSDQVDDQLKAEFLTVLHKKGETAEEIVAFVKQLVRRAVDPMIDPAQLSGPMIDICGTLIGLSICWMFAKRRNSAKINQEG